MPTSWLIVYLIDKSFLSVEKKQKFIKNKKNMRAIIYAIVWALFLLFVCYYVSSQRQKVDVSTIEGITNTEQEVEVINEVDGASYLNSDDESPEVDSTSDNLTSSDDENSEGTEAANVDDENSAADANSDSGDTNLDSNDDDSNSSSAASSKIVKDYAQNFIEKAYIEFGQNSTKLPKDDQFDTYLDSISNLVADGNHEVVLVGHADSATSKKQNNYQIGLRRAEFIKGMLTSKGVAGNIITVLSEGAESPRVQGDTKEAKTLNRRVELFIKQKN